MTSHILIRVPGYEPMYKYEVQPQKVHATNSYRLPDSHLVDSAWKMVDGVVSIVPQSFDATSARNNSAWMSQRGAKIYYVGPVLPVGSRRAATELASVPNSDRIQVFLSSVMKSHGSKSVLYISFGLFQWPTDEEKLLTVLDVIVEKRIPFILSHPPLELSDQVRKRIDGYELALAARECPQRYILKHPATGWFLTHCGTSSLIEATHAGVPVICWPFTAIDAFNAVHMAENNRAAYELFEVRTGIGAGRIYRSGLTPSGTPAAVAAEARRVLELAFGSDGAQRRVRLVRLRDEMREAWKGGEEGGGEKGASRVTAEELLADLGL
ncbi:uncharacterized protein BXZ73DRAFT_41634 [Epithele typhae]|uniref:uncharacterized protein n=1 Tax=Epithele typhae TaxID=378194 RepID=UPI0020080E88|nr:uncharacterized protein BXZ73DRAFT_41634 [Epithele typhae]KAH9941745.1 hypothetical protein BXZ73DRAFT_41634 [Epithele typhae]